jgi:hypothetical protein
LNGNVQLAILHQLQGPHGVESRHRIVGEDYIDPGIEDNRVLIPGVHALPRQIEPGPAQFDGHQFGIVRLAIENQDIQRGDHG